jgi:anaerobic C4-dicarboxylate transporter
MADEVSVPIPVREPVKIKPGELTSEYKQAQESSFWAKLMVILGLIINLGGVITQSLQQVQASNPDVGNNKTFMIIMLVVGTVITIAGGIQKALTDAAYISGRSLVKAAAARDAAPPPEV